MIPKSEFSKVVQMFQKMYGREFDDTDVRLWYSAIGHYPLPLVEQSLTHLWQTSKEFVTPALLLERMRQIAADRLAVAPNPVPPPAELTVAQSVRWRQRWHDAIICGSTRDEADAAALEAVGLDAALLPARSEKVPALTASRSLDEAMNAADVSDASPVSAGVVEGPVVA